jgi:pimeloyl-ACP methyl ester carboxylesterase
VALLALALAACATIPRGEAARKLIERHRAEPVPPLATPVALSAERYGRVPRVAIQTRDDRAVTYALQQSMWSATGGGSAVLIDGGHSPMLSRPAELADLIARFARESTEE